MNELTALRERVRELEARLAESGGDQPRHAAAEDRLTTLVGNAPLLLYFVTAEHEVTLFAGQGAKRLGLDPERVLGRDIRAERFASVRVITDDDVQMTLPEAVEHALGGALVTGRTPLEGELVFDQRLVPMRAEDGVVTGVLGIAIDVSEHERVRRALRQTQAQLRHLIDSGVVGTARIDAAATIIESNPALRGLVGYELAEIELARPTLWTLCHPSSRPDLARALDHLTERGRCGPVELSLADRQGRPVAVLLMGACLDGGRDCVIYVLDLSERQQLREQLLHAQKMEAVGRLAAGVAHDFNNMLAVIQGFASLVNADLPADSAMVDDVHQILTAAERAAQLTRKLLAFSRQQIMRPEIIDPNNVVAGLEQIVRRLIGEDVEVHLELDGAVGAIEADPHQVEQVLLNLVINARDAMPEGGVLTLRTERGTFPSEGGNDTDTARKRACVIISVRDTGHGMDDETAAHAFEPFFTTREPGVGTGLGLSTADGSVAQMGGRIELQTELGRGTTVRVLLPTKSAAVTSDVGGVAPPAFEGTERVLVAEDEPLVRQLVSMILQRHGYHVVEATSGEEAIEYCSVHRGEIDLVLSDVVMPRMSGPELRERLREQGTVAPFLFISGYLDRAARENVDPRELLPKPFLPDELLTRVRLLLDAGG